jgi:hypothetical protein
MKLQFSAGGFGGCGISGSVMVMACFMVVRQRKRDLNEMFVIMSCLFNEKGREVYMINGYY